MINSLFRRVTLFSVLLDDMATYTVAQDSGALLNALVRKGILSDQEAADIRAELTAESHAAVIGSVSGGKSTHALAISGRLQVQYAGINTDAVGKDSTNQLFVRRLYFGAKAAVGAGWTANLMYDFAGENFDKAYIEYAGRMGDLPYAVDLGVRKTNFGMEETTSSCSLDAIERSGVTRYFVEGSNGRRLGAGSYHVGAFFEGSPNARKGKTEGVFFGAVITNLERSSGPDGANSSSNNSQAYWADVGYTGFFGSERQNKFTVGAAASALTDIGGKTPTAGQISTASMSMEW